MPRARIALAAAGAAAAAGALAACGGGSSGSSTRAAPVRLRVTAPADAAVVHAGRVQLRGHVAPARADVRVQGRRATMPGGGAFAAKVALREGPNVIDVTAAAPGAAPALTAVRVTWSPTVAVPDVVGAPLDEARRRLAAAGLSVEAHESGGLLEPIIPGRPTTCRMSPAAGAEVPKATRVRIELSKLC